MTEAMTLNKERKVLLGLLGSAGLILGIDQLLLAPPQGAQAQSAPPVAATQSPEASTQPAPPAQIEASVIAWNEKLAGARRDASGEVGDPFQPPAVQRSAGPGLMSPAQFLSDHKLTAVLTGGEVGVAMVNGQAVRVGQEISGYRLVRVDARSAEFVVGEQSVRLELPNQSSAR